MRREYEIQYQAGKSGDNDRKYDTRHGKSCNQKDERQRGKSDSLGNLNDRDIFHVLVNVEYRAEHAPDAAHYERDRH